MPELPEVEAARRGIAEQLAGRTVTGFELYRPRLVQSLPGLSLDLLPGRRLLEVGRRGKYLWLVFEPLAAVVHLKLTGQLVARGDAIPGFAAGHPVPPYDAPLPHKSTALRLDFQPGIQLYLTDVRHFARLWLLPVDELQSYIDRLALGTDLLSPDFTFEAFRQRLERRRSGRLKPTLLDQSVVAGIGNIYADESLWQARLHPEQTVGELSADDLARLYEGIRETIRLAVPVGGARILHGKAVPPAGEFPFVHGREGQPCPRCGTTIVKFQVNGRGTYLCPRCQPAPAGVAARLAPSAQQPAPIAE
ncbi:bifunctional DNA-formamidopyrimidine glycosylase/DNA-(apurinic or apyrimidinic site) lyase [Thermomicrobiaceae bacterium CFH 74404]|uniref:Formamidopyrimidine-DNA glycosylase n=1 Tax=Thermalbibacter longus TaxID=2951981 RepID=A0AA41WCJ1_9BACT|nr:bifunctional DNA-formamidopyrimidine glycosylase/DNA-(apurinic or apyrimidinic site) lyase [Thermalbibacter longus]MCM8750679.1 bifunctional DNA-formamidopyrimidine glycosylase/DNA-(apurinic or apyrimidinic site) lyase [Thermalbibacter longus]